MPIYAPSLPPRPALDQGLHPALVIARFDFQRIRRQKLGMFIFGFIYLSLLMLQSFWLFTQYHLTTNQVFAEVQPLASQVQTLGADFQAWLIKVFWLVPLALWLHMALAGGGLIAKDTLYRSRPLIYAHPVAPWHYIAAKGLFAVGLSFLIQLPFVILPWVLSLLIAGTHGPVWVTTPLYLIPAALLVSLIIGSVTLGASSLASTPRAGFAWSLSMLLGMSALGIFLKLMFGQTFWNAVNPICLCIAWPELICGDPRPILGWIPTIVGTVAHMSLFLSIIARRTRPNEATL